MSGMDPAFPTQMWDIELKEATWLDGGLTKREYFAGLALHALMSRETVFLNPQEFAEQALKCADGFLAELAREKSK